jgi:hypothetical protein
VNILVLGANHGAGMRGVDRTADDQVMAVILMEVPSGGGRPAPTLSEGEPYGD